MRNMFSRSAILNLALLTALASGPALAWVPKLEEQSAKTIIDSAYGRRAAAPTFLTVNLGVKDGKSNAPDGSVSVFDGPATCLSDWLTPLSADSTGSRVASLTLSGQADQLLFQAQDARDNFKNMTPKEALAAFNAGVLPGAANDYGAKVGAGTQATAQNGDPSAATSSAATTQPPEALPALPDGQLRVDIAVKGLNDLQQRSAYLLRLKGPDGKLIAPVRFSYVNDWKAGEAGKQAGTLVYYFEPLKAGLNANDKIDLLLRTEQGACAYDFKLDLSKFN